MKRLLAAAAALLIVTPAAAQAVKQSRVDGNRTGAVVVVPSSGFSYPSSDGSNAEATVFANYEPTYQLLGTRAGPAFTTQNGTGTPQGPIYGATYIYRIVGTFSGCTANLQVLDADGVTWLTVQSSTAATTQQVTIGASPPTSATPNVRVQLTGCTAAPSLWANLS